jgi:DNA-binding NarL/FixJ family response regulator
MLAELIPVLNVRRIKHSVRPVHRQGNHSESRYFGHRVNGVDQRLTLKLALIDPKPLTRQSILNMLAAAFAEHASLFGAASFGDLVETIDSTEALNFIVLYIRSARVTDNWVQEQLQAIKAQLPDIPVIIMSDRDDTDDVVSALNHGIRGYIPTSVATEVAIAALTLIEAGGTYIPAAALQVEASEILDAAGRQIQLDMPQGLNLTSRELAVIDLLREGNANKVIAIKLNMRESTVKVHVRNILKKLRVNNRTHAATVANRLLANPHSPAPIAELTKPPQ